MKSILDLTPCRFDGAARKLDHKTRMVHLLCIATPDVIFQFSPENINILLTPHPPSHQSGVCVGGGSSGLLLYSHLLCFFLVCQDDVHVLESTQRYHVKFT